MPKLIIEGVGEVNVESGTRLVLALSDNNADNVHACGGFARCTTCQVVFMGGEPQKCTRAERDVLERNNKLGDFRLACQSLVNEDMHVRVLMKFSESGRPDPGQRPEDEITPSPEWIETS
jgi:ferredoxin